ncbi:MAG: TonB-dependent receptor [Flavipsychrobacter sp.]|nr:TonB-dependent receptor [Flavipsychrobacter sp.]
MVKYLYAVLFILLSSNVIAGTLKGSVKDVKNNGPLSGVVIAVTGSGKGAVTDFDGKYEITGIPAGTYEVVFSYTSYTSSKQTITIGEGQEITLDQGMLPENTELKDQVIKASKVTNTETSVITEIKNSNSIVSGTSAAQISKTMDRNAADVVKRIPGVTIQDDRFIVVRGLPDRYNTVWLNDASTPSSESDKKAFSFDVIPAGLIDRVMIFKTPSPELPGDFAGGMVKVYTTSLADKNQLTVSLQTSSREYSTGTNFNYNAPSKTDQLGYDDGRRSIPNSVPDYISSKNPAYKESINAWSKSFGNDWIVNTTKANPDARFSLAASNVWQLNKVKIGNTFGLAYANTNTNMQIHRQDWDSVSRSYNYNDIRSVNNVSVGVMDNVGVSIGNSKIEFKNLYNQIGTSSLTIRRTIKDTGVATNPDEKSYAMGYESRATYSSQLTGTHKNNKDTRKYTWGIGYNDLFKNQPDLRRIKYSKQQSDPDSLFRAQVSSNVDIINGGGRYYSSLYEHTYSFNHQFTQKVHITDDVNLDLSAGNYLEYKDRSYKIRQLGYVIKQSSGSLALTRLPINQIFADTNVGGSKLFNIGETTNKYDHYNGQNELIASFVSAKATIGKNINVVGGARYEYNIQSIQAYVNLDSIAPKVITKFLLHSVNASYNFSDKSLVRVAYGKTLNRPEFREWAPIFYYDFDELAGNKGSLFKTTVSRNKSGSIGDTLKVAQIQNYDIRYELYPSSGEMIQLGAFYKYFKDPIQRVVLHVKVVDSRAFSYINADNAYCYGVELDVRKNLSWIDSKLGTKLFKDLTLVGNLSLAWSQLTIDTAYVTSALRHSPIQGQSPYVVNAGIYYQNADNGFQGSLLYNVFGPRMYAVGTTDAGAESLGELPFQSFDCTISKLFHKHYMVNIGVQNLLGSRILFMKDSNRDNKFDSKDDRDYKSYYPGRYYSIGVKIKF